MNKDTLCSKQGEWQRPPCALCGVPVEASPEVPPVFLRDCGRWAHWACMERARRQHPELDRTADRGWKSVGQVLEGMGPPPWRDV